MVKLDVTCMRHLSKHDIRVLTAVEMGMKNHDLVPVELIASIAKLRHGGSHKILSTLLTFKLIAHDRSTYDGYRLTYAGYDILALNVLQARGQISAVGSKIGVGKEADIYMAQTPEGDQVVLKFHRLGRTSFRAVKNKRDYLRARTSASWLYMSRLSALKEFAFMKALFQHGFPTPSPLDQNRHVVLMSHAKGYSMYQLRSGEMAHPDMVYRSCVEMIVRLARHGLIHCDFNEFNLMIDDEERLTLIDFPQMVSTRHKNAKALFDRDVACIVRYFSVKMKHVPEESDIPSFADAVGADEAAIKHHLDVVAHASGFSEQEARDLDAFVTKEGWGGGDDTDSDGERPEEEPLDGDSHVGGAGEGEGEGAGEGVANPEVDGTFVDEEADGCDGEQEEEGDAKEGVNESDSETGYDAGEGSMRRVKAPESITKRVHAAVQRKRRGAGGAGAVNRSRNQQKMKVKGKVFYKHRDY